MNTVRVYKHDVICYRYKQDDVSFAGFYVGGNHSYTILTRSSNEIYLKTVGFDTNGWFIKITNQE